MKVINCVFVFILLCSFSTIGYTQKVNKKWTKQLKELVEESPVFSQSFTGFSVMDAANQETLYEYEADKYYTPASNTKLFTLYTCLNVLEEKMPALYYQEQDSIIVFWGIANDFVYIYE